MNSLPESIVRCLWRMSWQAGAIVLLLLLLRRLAGNRLSPAWRSRLWLLVALRLLFPVLPTSPLSLFNFLPTAAPSPTISWPGSTIVISRDAPTPIATAPKNYITRWMLLAIAWATGAFLLAGWIVVVNIRFARRLRHDRSSPSLELIVLLRHCGAKMYLQLLPEILLTDVVTTPALHGFLRPRLLLPRDLPDRLNPTEMQLVLLHELGHVRRNDLAIGWLLCILRVLHWFNPLLWVAWAQWRADAEDACDQSALAADGADNRNQYGHTLLKLATRLQNRAPSPVIGMLQTKSQLRHRLVQIARFENRSDRRSLAAVFAIIIACAALTDAQSPATKPSNDPSPPADTRLVTTVYDVSGIPVPNSIDNQSPPSKDADSFARYIQHAVTPKIWAIATIKVDGQKISVTAPPETQANIARLLEDAKIPVTIECTLFRCPISLLETQSETPATQSTTAPTASALMATKTDQIRKLLADAKKYPSLKIESSPRLHLFNHQQGSFAVRTEQPYVSAATPVRAPDGSISSFKPKIDSLVTDGFEFTATPTVSPTRDSIRVDLILKTTKLNSLQTRHQPIRTKSGTDIDGSYQIPISDIRDVKTTVSITNNQSVLIAGQEQPTDEGDLSPQGEFCLITASLGQP